MYLGLDWGQKKIGMAVVHEDVAIASAIGSIANDDRVLDSLVRVIEMYDVTQIVIGKSMHVSQNDNVTQIEQFGTMCTEHLHLPVTYVTEIFSTREAQHNLRAAEKKHVHKKDDAEAARIILQSYVDAQKEKL